MTRIISGPAVFRVFRVFRGGRQARDLGCATEVFPAALGNHERHEYHEEPWFVRPRGVRCPPWAKSKEPALSLSKGWSSHSFRLPFAFAAIPHLHPNCRL